MNTAIYDTQHARGCHLYQRSHPPLRTTKVALASWQASEESAWLFLFSYFFDDSNLYISVLR